MQESIFSTKVAAGGKTYFFDVKQAQAGKQSKYVQITETSLKGEEKRRSTVVIFADHLDGFSKALQEATSMV